MVDTSILGRLLSAFLFVFTAGYGHTIAHALWLLQTLATIEMALLALYWTISEDHFAGIALSKIFTFGVLVWLLTSWPQLMKALQDSFITWGITAGGGVVTVADFRSPGQLFTYGAQVGTLLIAHLQSFQGWTAVLANIVEIGMTGALALFVLAAFAVLTIQVAIALLEFYLIATLAILLLPWGAFRPLAFLAEKAIGGVIAHGIKLTVLAFIISAALPVLTFMQLDAHPTIEQVLALCIGVGFLWGLSWKGTSLAMGLLAGSPVLSAQSAVQTATSMGAAAGLGAGAALRALQSAGGGVRGATAASQNVLATTMRAGGLRGGLQLAASSGRSLAAATIQRYTTPSRSGMQAAAFRRQIVPSPEYPHGGMSVLLH